MGTTSLTHPPAPRLQTLLRGWRGAAQGSDVGLWEFLTNIYFKGWLPLASVSGVVLACLETASKQKGRPLKREGCGSCMAIYPCNQEENLPVILPNKYKLEARIKPMGIY